MFFDDIEKDYLIVRSKYRPFNAPLERSANSIDNRLLKTDLGTRILPVSLHLEYSNFSEFERLKEDMGQWLIHEEPKKLRFTDDPDRFYWAALTGNMEYDNALPTSADVVVNFMCGYKYSDDREIVAEGNHIIYGHKSTTWKTQTIFTEAATSYEFKFYRAGHDTSLRNINVIKINYQFTVGDTLVIDFSRRAVLLNDNDITNSLVILQSNFMELPVGEVIFEASEETEVFYNERYY